MNKPIKKATGKVALVKPDQVNSKTKAKQVIAAKGLPRCRAPRKIFAG